MGRGMKNSVVVGLCAVVIMLCVGCRPKTVNGNQSNSEPIVYETYGYDVSGEDVGFLADVMQEAEDINGAFRLKEAIGMDTSAYPEVDGDFQVLLIREELGLQINENEKREYFYARGNYHFRGKGPAGGYIIYDCDADNDSGNADGLKSYACGWRFLEAAPENLSNFYEWGDYGDFGTRTEIGTGKRNTELIVSKSTEIWNNAARACMDYSINGYDDWFLPSKDELDLMYVNRKKIGGFDSYYYWSSSEDSYSADYVWRQGFGSGGQYDSNRDHENRVRPLRAF